MRAEPSMLNVKWLQRIAINIYEKEKFHAQLSWAWKKLITLGPSCMESDSESVITSCMSLRYKCPSIRTPECDIIG